jgi:hypothetical protein
VAGRTRVLILNGRVCGKSAVKVDLAFDEVKLLKKSGTMIRAGDIYDIQSLLSSL